MTGAELSGVELTEAISASMVALYARHYGHDRTTGTTYFNENVVVCVLEDILSVAESSQVADGGAGAVIDGRVAFQTDMEDEFTKEIERLTGRGVTAFMSANQTTPGVACELFFLEPRSPTSFRRPDRCTPRALAVIGVPSALACRTQIAQC